MKSDTIVVRAADAADAKYAKQISEETERSAIARGSGISKRPPSVIIRKMLEGKAVIAVTNDGRWAGFSYIETWSNEEFVSNSGLIVCPDHRNKGVAARIKKEIFRLCRNNYPNASIFSITTGLAIMKMNERLGFKAVTFNEITHEASFWKGCKSCVNYNILKGKQFKNCLCTAMCYSRKKVKVDHQ
jgi:GNAT superfamily N-acetyltransferase